MVAKHVELAASRCGETREEATATFDTGANRNGCGSILVALEVGNAVSAAEAQRAVLRP